MFFSPHGSQYPTTHPGGFLPSIDKNNQSRNGMHADPHQRTPSNLRSRELQGMTNTAQKGATMSLLNNP